MHSTDPIDAEESTGERAVTGDRGIAGIDAVRPDADARDPREELRRIDALNGAIEAAVRALGEATTHEEIEDAIDPLVRTDLYEGVTVQGTVATWRRPGADPDVIPDGTGATAWRDRAGVPAALEPIPGVPEVEHGSWALVPVRCGRTPYGHLVLASSRPVAFRDRELATLDRFGTTVGQAVAAVEDRRLLRSDAVTELAVEATEDALVAVARAADCGLSLQGTVPERNPLAFFSVEGADAPGVADAAREIDGVETARAVDPGTVELALSGGSALVALARGGTNLRTAEVDGDGARVVVELVPDADLRVVLDCVREHAPDVTLAAKRGLDRPPATDCPGEDAPEGPLSDLTERQREVVEAACQSGYFEWPRERTAEEVAESLGISSPTFHKHLRRAEGTLLSAVLGDRRRPR